MISTAKAFFLVVGLVAVSTRVHAEVSIDTVHRFLDAQTQVYNNGSADSVEHFVAFMADDIKDYHFAYGREFSGKDFYRKNMPVKAEALMSYERKISQVTVGTGVAIATFFEVTKERKRDGKISDYQGRTIMVIEFNAEGLITQLRRYQD
ncbi:MAG: hypothetical protein AB8B96_03030 [Lysobacterales bacterium]